MGAGIVKNPLEVFNGGCSSVAEHAVVVRKTRVRFSPSALYEISASKECFIRSEARTKKKVKMKILFVCKYNAFRSRIAEEYFRKVNRNKNVKIMGSRGFIMGGDSDREQRKIAKQLLGVNLAKRKPLPLSLQEMIKADKIIVVANDVPMVIFDYKLVPLKRKVAIWRIRDEQRMNKKNIKRIVLEIKRRVDELNKKMEGK